MAYELAWQFDGNRSYTPADAADLTKYHAWYLAAALLGNTNAGGMTGSGKWTFLGMSNGTYGALSASTNDDWQVQSGTYAAASSSLTQSTTDPNTTAHSWVALRSPAMPNGQYSYMVISLYATNLNGFSVFYARDSWILNTGGSARLPTSTTRIPGGSTEAATAAHDGVSAAHTFNACLASNGQFYVFDVKTGTGALKTARLDIWAPVTGYMVNDNFPFYNFSNFDGTYGYGAVPGLYTGATARNNTRNAQGIVASWSNLLYGANSTVPGASSRDQATGAVWDFPFLIYATNGSVSHARGRVQDLAWMPADASNVPMAPPGSLIKESGAIRYATLDSLIVPWTGSLVL